LLSHSMPRVITISDNLFSNEINKLLVLNSFLNLTSDGVYVIDLTGRVLEVNKKYEEMHGYTREEIIGKEIPLTPEERTEALKVFERLLAGEEVMMLEVVKRRKNGSYLYVDVTISPVNNDAGELIAFVVIERDITEKRKAEEKLRESEERYRVLVDNSPVPIVVYQDFVIVFANPAAMQLMGANEPQQLIGQHVSRFVHQEDVPILLEELYRFLETGELCDVFEKRLIRCDKEDIYVECKAVPIEFQGIKSVQLLFRDMTARKKAESELADREKEFTRVIQLSPEPILLHEAGIVTFVNDRAINLLKGTSTSDFVGLHILDFFCPSSHPTILRRMKTVVEIDGYMEFQELKLKPLDGIIIDVEVSSICLHKDPRYPIVQVVVRDLTERKKTEEMIRRSDKLSVAGELAAGVAHEIRNPLTALKGFMQLLRAKNTDYVDIMLGEIDRISEIVNEFIGMAKPQAMNFIECDLKALIDNVILFMHPQALLCNVQMTFSVHSRNNVISCEPNQIKQVYMNVLKNAIESMPHGGLIEISLHAKENGTFVTRIIDQGIGIPEERMEKIGEPFFSLKESGTGLGLMVCRRIIDAHNGNLSIHSVVNQGTTIEIELPTTLI
jgi:two-component system sporulation sensor kinase A